MWIDSHAHLYNLGPEALAAALCRAAGSSVTEVLNCGTSLATSQRVAEQCSDHPALLRAAVGISPFDVVGLPSDWLDQIRVLASAPGVVAIGEAGLDTSNPRYPDLAEQIPVFEAQLDLSEQLRLPIVVHSRGCEVDTARRCRAHRKVRAVFHCFTGTADALHAILDAGYTVSYSGIVTFKKSPLPALVAHTPVDRILVETDSPYLAPEPHRGHRNEPAWVALTGECIARIKGSSAQECASALRANFDALFGGAPGPGLHP
jgi:TatD DNase family protein